MDPMGTLPIQENRRSNVFSALSAQSVAPWQFPKVWFRCAPIGRSLGVGRYPSWCFMVNFRLRNPFSPPKKSTSCLPNFKPPSHQNPCCFLPNDRHSFVASRFGGFGECVFSGLKMQPCDPSSAFFGFMGVTSAFLFGGVGWWWRSNYHPWFRWRKMTGRPPF